MKDNSAFQPFRISAPSMVFGPDLAKNVRQLVDITDNIEIVLFHTPELNNLPKLSLIAKIKEMADQRQVTFTVHLPATLELASQHPGKREQAVQMAAEIFHLTAPLNPLYYIVHIPFTRPTLVPVPGLYFRSKDPRIGTDWLRRALASLAKLHDAVPATAGLLVENINYAPSFLEVFLDSELCELCLDLGHLLLGREDVIACLQQYVDRCPEIHIHGVQGTADHFSVVLLPGDLVLECLRCLKDRRYSGLLNLEVFSPLDLKTSLDCLQKNLRLL